MPEDNAGRSKWGGISEFAKLCARAVRRDAGQLSIDAVESELRRRVEPLLEAAEALLIEDMCGGRRTVEADGSEPEKAVAKELDTWKS